MRASMYEYMKVGVVHFKAFPEVMNATGPIVETLRQLCEDDFFTAIEVGKMKDVKVRAEAARILEISGMEVAYAFQPTFFPGKLSLNHLDPKERQKAINAAFNCLKEAYDLGATTVRIPAGKDPGPERREEAKELLIDSMRQILDRAKEMGNPRVSLKIFDRDIDKESLIGPAQDALDVAKVLAPEYPQFNLLPDLSHFPLLREEIDETLPLLKDYIRDAHIGTCVMHDPLHLLYGDLQPRFGVGEVDIPMLSKYFRTLVDLGVLSPEKRPIVSAEVRPMLPGETSELVLANTKRAIKEAWALA